MARFHLSSILALCLVLLCTIYWLQRPATSYYDDSIRTQLAPKDDDIMRQADGGGSKIRFVKSHSGESSQKTRSGLSLLEPRQRVSPLQVSQTNN